MASTVEERKAKISNERRQQILSAALDVFTREGFASARTAEIARVAGVAEGTIYNYFSSKRELFIAVIKNFIITMPLLNLIDKIPEGDIEEVFKNILKNRLELAEDVRVSRMPSLIGEILRDPELKELWVKEFLQPFLSRMEMGYRFISTTGKYRQLDPVITVRTVGGMIIGLIILKIMEGEASPLTRLSQDEVAKGVVNLMLHGLLNDSQGKEK